MTANYTPPELILLSDYKSLDEFLNYIYKIFNKDFQINIIKFKGQKVTLRKRPSGTLNEIEYDWTFHHIITTDKGEERVFDKDRAERIKFPGSFIKNEAKLLGWSSFKNNEKRYYISDPNFEYLVILSQRNDYILLLTAYNTSYNNTKRKLKKAYESTIKPDFIL